MITVRLPMATRNRIEALAKKEGRSLSQTIERLIDQAMGMPRPPGRPLESIKGIFADRGPAPTLKDFRQLSRELVESVDRKIRRFDKRHR